MVDAPPQPLPRPSIARRLLEWTLGSLLAIIGLQFALAGWAQFEQARQDRYRTAQQAAERLADSLPLATLERIWSPADRPTEAYRSARRRLADVAGPRRAAVLRQVDDQAMVVVPHGLGAELSVGDVLTLSAPGSGPWRTGYADNNALLVPLPGKYRLLWLDAHPPALGWWRQYLLGQGWLLAVLALFALGLALWHRQRYGLGLTGMIMGMHRVLRDERPGPVRVPAVPALREMAQPLNRLVDQVRDQYRLRATLDRYLSRAVVQRMSQDENFATVRGEKRVVTVLFADLFNFTDITDRNSPEEVVEMLNAGLGELVNAVHSHHGTLDKYVGDGLMAIFGAPDQDPDHAVHAVRAALDMQNSISRLRRDLGLPELRLGVGINTGPAVVGNIGSEERLQYTAIGGVVNLASRLENFTRHLGAAIIVSSETRQRIGDEFLCERIDGALLKGVRELLTVFRVKGRISDTDASHPPTGEADQSGGRS